MVGTFGRRKIAMGTDGGFSRHPRVGGHGVPTDGKKFLPTSSCACRIQTNQSEKCLRIRLSHAAASIREYYLIWTVIPFSHGADVHQGARREASILKESST